MTTALPTAPTGASARQNGMIQMTETTKTAIKVPKTKKTDPYGYGVAPLADYETSTGEARGLGWLVLTSKSKEACLDKALGTDKRPGKIPAGVAFVVLSFVAGIGNGPAERAGIILGARKSTKAYNRDGKAIAMPAELVAIKVKPTPKPKPTTERKEVKAVEVKAVDAATEAVAVAAIVALTDPDAATEDRPTLTELMASGLSRRDAVKVTEGYAALDA